MSSENSLPTASDGNTDFNFNGVFRDVHVKTSRDKLYQAQALISQGKWKEAEEMLNEALAASNDEHDKRNLKLILSEMSMYQERVIPEGTKAAANIDWQAVGDRRVQKYFEKFDALPESVFLLRSSKSDRVIAGRRVLSHQYVANKIRELHCSHITPSMFLGKLVDQRITEDGVVLFYTELLSGEKVALMEQIITSGMSEYELTFPFPALIGQSKEEIQSPEGGWEIDEKLALSLGEGEVYLREFSMQYLKSIGKENLRLFDCACSTGQFLYTMKQGVPGSYTIGSDLSEHMVKFAAKRVDEISCANALEPKVPPRSVDVVFVRFINSEVVKTAIASIFFRPLTECLKKGGSMIIFGHTPVLSSAAEIKMLAPNLEISQCIGGSLEWNGIFQYYICKRLD